MRLALIFLSALLLAGCNTTKPTLYTVEYKIVDIPKELYNCPVVRVNYRAGMTERDVANLLLRYSIALKKCNVSQEAIKAYVEKAKQEIEAGNHK